MDRNIGVTGALLLISTASGANCDDELMNTVTKFGDTVIQHGRDNYGKSRTPLFVDVLNVETLKSPDFFPKYGGGGEQHSILSNFACQQNLLRVLVSLSQLTGEDKYRLEAEKATRYMFDHFWHEASGLFYWGTHRYIILEEEGIQGEKGDVHELKGVYPFYDFLYEVDPDKTTRLIKGIWEAHISDWSVLTFNRHGPYGSFDAAKVWDREWKDPGSDVRASGLTFFDAGSDLIYAGFLLGINAEDKEAALWAERMFEQFVNARDNNTLIMPWMSARQKNRERGKMQFNFPNAYEPNLYVGMMPELAIGHNDYAMLRMVERLAQAGYHEASEKLKNALCEHLIGYARYSYNPKENVFRPIITDGTDLTGYKLPVSGYFGPEGKEMEPIEADDYFLPVYALAYRLREDKEIWNTLRSLCKGNGLGDIGKNPGDRPDLDYSTTVPYTRIVFTFVDIYRATGNGEYLEFAEHICKNILKLRYHPENGLFTLDKDHLGCHLDCYEPLALLTVAAAKQGKLDLIPTWDAGGNYIWNHNLVVSGYSRIARFAPHMGRFLLHRSK